MVVWRFSSVISSPYHYSINIVKGLIQHCFHRKALLQIISELWSVQYLRVRLFLKYRHRMSQCLFCQTLWKFRDVQTPSAAGLLTVIFCSWPLSFAPRVHLVISLRARARVLWVRSPLYWFYLKVLGIFVV